MHRSRITLFVLVALTVGTFVAPSAVIAQESNVCTAVVRDALTQTVVNCADTETGLVCYGFPEIDSVLQDEVEPETFDEAGELVDAVDVVTLRPRAIDLTTSTSEESWGIVVMNLLTSLPAGVPDDVVVIGFGGAEIESDVPVDEAFTPLEAPLPFTTTTAGELREASLTPPADAEVIEQIASGTALTADAVSQDGDFVRVLIGDQPGWLSAGAFDGLDLSELPVLTDGQLSPMQAFYLRTGIDSGTCAPNASWILVQSPEEMLVEMIIYDVPMRLEGTMLLRTLTAGEPVGEQMQLVVPYGVVTVNPHTEDKIIVPAGYSLLIGLGPEFVSLGIEGDEDERSGTKTFGEPTLFNQQLLDDLSFLDQLPADIFNYEVESPILTQASGTGLPLIDRVFPDPGATSPIEALCATGALSPAICAVYGFPTP